MHVYFILASSAKPRKMKIGKAKDPEKRLRQLQTGCPYQLKLIGTIRCKSDRHAIDIEKAAHELFSEYNHLGEWFKCSDFVLSKVWELTSRFDVEYKSQS